MKIHTFEYRNLSTKWEIQPIRFKDLTLLVGASGVGKPRILRALNSLKRIASGSPLNGVEWEIVFSIGVDSYAWEGQYDISEKT